MRPARSLLISAAALTLGAEAAPHDASAGAAVIVTPLEVTDFAVGSVPKWGVRVGVAGEAPAYRVRLRQVVAVLPFPDLPAPVVDKILRAEAQRADVRAVLASGTTLDGAWRAARCPAEPGYEDCPPFSQDVFDVLRAGAMARLYLVGEVAWDDASGAPHRTPICFTYAPAEPPGSRYPPCGHAPTSPPPR